MMVVVMMAMVVSMGMVVRATSWWIVFVRVGVGLVWFRLGLIWFGLL